MFLSYLLLLLAGLGAGLVNVLAGGGSMLTLPALTFLGLDISVANGTNRIGILLQNVIAVRNFKKGEVLEFKRAILLTIPSVIGAILGTLTVVGIKTLILKKIVGIIFLIMSIFILYKPKVWEEGRKIEKRSYWLSFLIFLGIGFYGGFIQAGVGFFLITGLVLIEGYDIVKTNAIKVFIVLCYTVFSLMIFAVNGKVDLVKGLILSVGTMLGGYIGSKTAIKSGAKFVRIVVFVMIVISALKYLL